MRSRPARPKVRDYFLKALILGSVKGGAHTNHKVRANLLACRKKITTQMPAAVIPTIPNTDIVLDWERDTDLFRVYANMEYSEGTDVPDIREIHLLDESLNPQAVVNVSMFNELEWDDIYKGVMNEWDRMNA